METRFAKDVSLDGVQGRGENVILGFLAGLMAAIAGSAVWTGITLATHLHIGYVALVVGAIIGLAIRFAGNGRSAIFGLMGAVLTLAACLVGEVIAVVQEATTPEHDFYSILTTIDLVQVVSNIFTHMDPLLYLIYGIGIFEGYTLSMRK